MSKVTRFAAADPGPTARVSGFIAHLRENGFRLGVAETETALHALSCVNPIVPADARLALKSVCAGSIEDITQFDLLFDAFWMTEGRVRQKVMPPPRHRHHRTPTPRARTIRKAVRAKGPFTPQKMVMTAMRPTRMEQANL
jgi:uncharacterized protein with von Willebrand factor type A (vWA) domain